MAEVTTMEAQASYTWKNREERKRLAERLYGDGWTMQRIAQALNVSHPTIVRDLVQFVPAEQTSRPKGGRPKGSGPHSLFTKSATNKPTPAAVAKPDQQTEPAEQSPAHENEPWPATAAKLEQMSCREILSQILHETIPPDRYKQELKKYLIDARRMQWEIHGYSRCNFCDYEFEDEEEGRPARD
jgi:hypothetical protein